MIKSLGILLVAGTICLFEVPPLLKKQQKKELLVFSILLLFGVALSIFFTISKSIPNPLDYITFIFKPFSEVIAGVLK
jgi:Na+/melibiose symporter-like transporter